MGKISQGVLGGFSGKVGPVVGSSWKGIAVMKSMPLSVANPRTASQVAHRDKFKFVSLFASLILAGVIKPLRDRFAQKQSGYNSFVQDNLSVFNKQVPTNLGDVVIAKGAMQTTPIASVVVDNPNKKLTVSWADDSGQGMKIGQDKPYFTVLVYTTATREFVSLKGFTPPAERNEEVAYLFVDEQVDAGQSVCVWLNFKRTDGTVVGNTAYKVI